MKKEFYELKRQYKLVKRQINQRLEEFSHISAKNYFYELCFCLLTPQSNAEKCWLAVEKLKKCQFKSQKIESCLKRNRRFYKNQAKYIKEASKKWPEIKEKIQETSNPLILRDWLAANAKGLGMKEASHFLRNIGKSHNKLAILDRHILRNLRHYKIINEIPFLNKKNYLEIEEKMKQFAKQISIPLDELDLFLWQKQTGKIFK